jgi:hypothetical protein
MSRQRHSSEQERLDRIERYIKQLADASAALQDELQIARQLAAKRARALKLHAPQPPRPKESRKGRGR